jgi:hypothetical protein
MVVGVGVAWWWCWAIVIVALAMMGLLALSHRLYRWFIKKRGLFFSLRAIPLHWAYFLYSGLTFGADALRFLMKSWTKPALGASVLKRTLSLKSVQSEKSK